MLQQLLNKRAGLVATLCFTPLVMTGCATPGQHPIDAWEEGPDEPITAAAVRYQQRLSADGTVPPNALMRAKGQRDQLLHQRTGAGIWPDSWEWIGPGNIGGRIRPIVIHPTSPNIMWVGSASGGVWKTTTSGLDWQPMDDFMATLSVGCMVMDPSDPDTLYVGTGEGFFEITEGSSNTAAVRGAGIFKSTDAGVTWNQMASTTGPEFHFVNRLAIDPTNTSIMLAATGSGVWRTTDGGTNWSQRATFKALDVQLNPNDSSKVVAGGHHEENGPYYSTDGGVTWTQASGAGGHRQEMKYAPSNPSIVYAAVSDSAGAIKVWRSANGGQSYTLRTSGSGMQTWASYNNTLWVDPTNSNFLIVGGVRLHRSTNGGVSFSSTFGSVHPDMHGIVAHPNFDGVNNATVYFATDGGIHQTANVYGASSSSLNNNLGITQFYGGAINPTTGHVVGGTQDNGTLFYSGNPQNWDHIFGGDGGYGAADQTDPNFYYGEVQRARIHRSRNAGGSSSYIWNTQNPIGDAGGFATNFIPFFMLDPNNQNRMLVACERLWRSNNVKANSPDWFSIKPSIAPPGPIRPAPDEPSHFAPNSPYNIATIEVARGNPDIVWVGHNNGELWMTTNGTTSSPSWTRVDDNTALPDRWPSTIVVDANDHNRVYVAFMGWEEDNLWLTEDAGQSWERITGAGGRTLPSVPISALNIHRTRPGWLYVGTDLGVFTSGDDGRTWTTSTDGPGTVPVEQLTWKNKNALLAVTHGRGMYVADVIEPAPLADLAVVFGSLQSGGLSSLVNSDGDVVSVASQFGFSAAAPNLVELLVGAMSSAASPSMIELDIDGRLNNPGGSARVWLQNWKTGEKDEVHQYGIGLLGQTEQVSGLDPAKYVRSSDGRVELSIRHSVVATFAATGFRSSIDRVAVFVR